MPVFHSGQSRLVWHALFESGMRKNEINPEEKKIFIISPWIRDLTSSIGDSSSEPIFFILREMCFDNDDYLIKGDWSKPNSLIIKKIK